MLKIFIVLSKFTAKIFPCSVSETNSVGDKGTGTTVHDKLCVVGVFGFPLARGWKIAEVHNSLHTTLTDLSIFYLPSTLLWDFYACIEFCPQYTVLSFIEIFRKETTMFSDWMFVPICCHSWEEEVESTVLPSSTCQEKRKRLGLVSRCSWSGEVRELSFTVVLIVSESSNCQFSVVFAT